MSARTSIRAVAPAVNGIGRARALATCSRSTPVCSRSSLQSCRPLVAAPKPRTTDRQSPTPRTVRHASSAAPAGEAAKTPLYELHAAYGAKFVPFGGYSMPVQYKDLGVSESHKWTREKASLFDVSHMVQQYFSGPGAAAFLSLITPASVEQLQPHHSTLSCLLHPEAPNPDFPAAVPGGIVDDTIITRLGPDKFYVVTNAGCREKDAKYLSQQLKQWRAANKPVVEWEVLEGQGLVALQGPLATEVLTSVIAEPEKNDVSKLYFGQSAFIKLRYPSGETSSPLHVARGGYTGEDGFEISIPGSETTSVTQLLLDSATPDRLRLAGLGARDSLRLEAGMCLYGHDLNDDITPPEASLAWVVGKERRTPEGATFHGASNILQQLKKVSEGGGTARKRVGLVVEGAPAREGAKIVDRATGDEVGVVTSGCPSPTLGKNIAMAYVRRDLQKAGTELDVVVRGKKRPAKVVKMPFVPSKYWKAPA